MYMFIFQVLKFMFPISCKMKWARKKKKEQVYVSSRQAERGWVKGDNEKNGSGRGVREGQRTSKHQPRHHTKALMNQIVGNWRNKCRKLCESFLTHHS